MVGRHRGVAGDRKLAAEVEQVVLHVDQQGADRFRQRLGEQRADARIELVDRADGGDPEAVLVDARAVAQAGRS